MTRVALMTTASLLAVLGTTAASGAVVASDDFSYGDGALAGNNGGSGWASAWAKRPGTNTDAVTGGVASVSGDNSAVFNNQGASYRTMNTTLGDDENDAWISVDLQRTGGSNPNNSFVVFSLIAGAPPATGDPSGTYFIGEGWTGNAATDALWGINGNGVAGTDSAVSTTLVVHVDFGAGTTSLYINPTGGSPLGAADLTVNAAPAVFDTIIFRSGGATGTHELSFDNLTVATSAEDLGFVPEPGSLALLGLGGLAVLRRRRG